MTQRIIILLLLVICRLDVTAQELITTQKITKDSISIKWLPLNFDQYKMIALNGAKVSRLVSSKKESYFNLNFGNAKTWVITPTKDRFDKLNDDIPNQQKQKALIESVYTNNLEQELIDFAFSSALSENVVNPNFQFVLGNILVDKTFNKKETYVYKIEVKGFEDTYVFINPKVLTSYPSIENVSLTLDKKKTAELIWNKKDYEILSFGYDIEHSMDQEKEGNYLDTLPFIPFSTEQQIDQNQARYRHSPEPGHFHFYRINGIDLFGHHALLSEWKKIYVPLLVNAWVEIDTLYAIKNERIIEGSIHITSKNPSIKNVLLMRSTDKEGNYQTIQNIAYQDSLVRFSVTENETGDHYYYKLALSNKDDSVFSVQRYLFTLDQKPPNPPAELKGRIDSSGIVTLQWEAPEDKDIKGYRVFRANQKSEEFIEITSQFVTKTNFIDTLALDNLTSEVFYCMRATDLNYNQSTMSDTILILKPDTIPPIPCVLVDVLAQDSLLKISWVNSDSKDLENNFLVRMNNESTDTLFNWKNTASSYEDYDILPGTNYVYTIVSIDKSANSASSRVFARFYEPGYRNPLMNFKAISDKENKLVNLSWEKPKDKIYSYQIFRSKEGEKLRQLKTITDSSIISFTDKNVRINNKYNYSIKYVNQDGIHSIPAKAVVVYP